ncbi:MAG: glycosyltransferase [Armatimonadetes bacterium]|nr:glycosyltransferase [Armatimonadota bacterium]
MSSSAGFRVLVVSPTLPYPPSWGFGIRVYQFLRHLSRRHEVTLLTYVAPEDEAHVEALRSVCADVRAVPLPCAGSAGKRLWQARSILSPASFQRRRLRTPQMQAALDRLLAEREVDIIQVESSQMAGFDFGRRAPVLLDEHNIEYELLHRMCRSERSPARRVFNWLEYLKFRREEQRAWRRASGLILTSEREERIVAARVSGRPTLVAPNGVDTDYFRPGPSAPDPNHLVFSGLMRYRPNADAAAHFVRDILPRIRRVRPDTILTLVGRAPTDDVKRLAGPNVVVTGGVPDVRPYVARASVFVVPLRMGGGTRLKVLEGLAMGKAMVSTPLGCEGIDVRHGEHLLVAEDPDAFAQATLRLMDDAALRESLGRRGRLLVERDYDWAGVVRRLEAFYAEAAPAR